MVLYITHTNFAIINIETLQYAIVSNTTVIVSVIVLYI
jgi:hypothetical protein